MVSHSHAITLGAKMSSRIKFTDGRKAAIPRYERSIDDPNIYVQTQRYEDWVRSKTTTKNIGGIVTAIGAWKK